MCGMKSCVLWRKRLFVGFQGALDVDLAIGLGDSAASPAAEGDVVGALDAGAELLDGAPTHVQVDQV
jgi:hypothetical protein